jgi:hypothetical protein
MSNVNEVMEFDKFIVLKVEDLEEALDDKEVLDLLNILATVKRHRAGKDQTPEPKYYVVNTDEKYAPAIKAVIENEGIPKPKIWINEDSI